jgi:hypothetical protein
MQASLPAVAAGLSVPLIGLSVAAYCYGAMVILLAVISMIASLWTQPVAKAVQIHERVAASRAFERSLI